MPQNWKGPLGPVTFQSTRGDVRVFSDLISAVRQLRKWRMTVVGSFPDSRDPLVARSLGLELEKALLRCDCGVIIPVWRVEEEARALEPLQTYRRSPSYDPEKHFRAGPLPRMGFRRRYGRMFRSVATRAELRDLCGLEADMQDVDDFPVRVKIRGRRKDLPTAWDDICISRKGDGWKRYRKAQYKILR